MELPRRICPAIRQVRAAGALALALSLALAETGCRREDRSGLPQGGAGAAAGVAAAEAVSPGLSPAPGATGSAGKYGAFQSVFTDVARKAIPSVVSITSERTVTGRTLQDPFGGQDPFDFFFGPPRGPQNRRESGLGSGFIATADGIILTNNHVVEGAQKLTVQLADEREFEAEIVGIDPATDLAVVKIKGKPGNLAPMEFGDSDKLLIGEWVVAVGAPFGLFETVTSGIISAKGRQNTGITTYGNFLQTDAAINPGNSGGPLVNLEGKVIGINTAIFSQSGGYQGIGFAIPVNLARTVMESLIKEGKVTRGWLGVSIQPLSEEMAEALDMPGKRGALVGDVLPGAPAEKAGIRRGDVILSLDGKDVRDANDLLNRIAQVKPGTTVALAIWRDGRRRDLKAKVSAREEERLAGKPPAEEKPDGAGMTSLGIEVTELNEEARQALQIGPDIKGGLVVTAVNPAGAAAEAEIREGDVILEANRKPVDRVGELRDAIGRAPKGKSILLLLYRQGSTFFALVTPR